MPTVMIAEDDLVVANMLEEVLVDNGYHVCGIASDVDKAVELGKRYKPDLAILDIRLAKGGLGTDIPARLKSGRRMGVLYASGHVPEMGLTSADGDALLTKPYRAEDVVRALKIVEGIVITDSESRHLPKGFSVLNPRTDANKSAIFTDAEFTEQISRLRRQQAELARFGFFALGEHDLYNVFMEAARISVECSGFPYCTIYQYRPEENDLSAEGGFGWNEGVIGRVVSQIDETSPQGRAFIGRKPLACDDFSKDKSFVPPSHYIEYGIVSTLNVVIWNDFQPRSLPPYGVLEVDSPVQSKNYGAFDIDFLTGIANILAQVIGRTQRKMTLDDAADLMKSVYEDRKSFLGAKSGPLGEKNELLKRLLDQISLTEMLRSDHG